MAKVTRKDVARRAGTSVAVVSYVVNDGPRPVAPETRKRVLNAIDEIGYRPDSIAKALASGSTRSLGLIVPNIDNPFLSALAHEVGHHLFARDRVMLLADSADSTLQEVEVAKLLVQQQVDGLIFYGVDRQHDFIEQYAQSLPIVVLDDPGNLDGVGYVRVDEQAAAAMATQHLVDHGSDSIGIIAGPLSLPNSQDRLNGWRDVLRKAGHDPSDSLVFQGPFTRDGGYEAGMRLLEQEASPESVFVSNEQQALGLLAAADQRGVSVPNDLRIVCFNGTSSSKFSIPTLTAVEQPLQKVAHSAVEMLTQPVFSPKTIMHEVELVRRRSCGCDEAGQKIDTGEGDADEARH